MLDKAKTFENLILWQKAQNFVLFFILFTQVFQKSKVYSLTTPSRRSSTSIVTNI
jgi:four helix bundle protein